MPSGPISETPPKIANKTNKEGISVPLEIMYGFSILSIVPINKTDQTRSPIACMFIPVKKRKIIAGMATIDVPKVGTKEAIPATTAQIAGLGIPKIIKPTQARIPWAIAIIKVPLKILLIESLRLRKI